MLRANESRLPELRKQVSRGARKGVRMKCRDAACRVYGGGKQHPVMLYFKCRDAACRVTGATNTIQLRGTPRPYIVEVGKNECIWRYLKPKPRHKWQVVAEALHVAGPEKVAAGFAPTIGLIVFE